MPPKRNSPNKEEHATEIRSPFIHESFVIYLATLDSIYMDIDPLAF